MASILNVDQINNAAGTSAITIDSSGNMALGANLSGTSRGSIVAPHLPIQINYIRSNSQTNFNGGTTPVAIDSSHVSITALRSNSDFIYACAIPAEHDSPTAQNVYAQLYRRQNGGSWGYVDNCTSNLQAPADNATTLNTSIFMDYNHGSITAGDVIEYKIYVSCNATGTNLFHFNQPSLSGQPSNESTNFSHGYVMEIAQ